MNSAHISDSADKSHISGEILHSEMDIIYRALSAVFGEEEMRLKSRDDLHAGDPRFALNVYAYRTSEPGGKDFLIGGNSYMDYDTTHQRFRRIVEAFEGAGVIFSMELDDMSKPTQRGTVSVTHPDYSAQLRRASSRNDDAYGDRKT